MHNAIYLFLASLSSALEKSSCLSVRRSVGLSCLSKSDLDSIKRYLKPTFLPTYETVVTVVTVKKVVTVVTVVTEVREKKILKLCDKTRFTKIVFTKILRLKFCD